VSEEFSVFAKLGFIDSTVQLSARASSGGIAASGSASSSAWTTGAGLPYDVSRQWGLRAEYDIFPKLGDKNKTAEPTSP